MEKKAHPKMGQSFHGNKNSERPSRYSCVGCPHSPWSHSYLCSQGFTQLPSYCNTKLVGFLNY